MQSLTFELREKKKKIFQAKAIITIFQKELLTNKTELWKAMITLFV